MKSSVSIHSSGAEGEAALAQFRLVRVGSGLAGLAVVPGCQRPRRSWSASLSAAEARHARGAWGLQVGAQAAVEHGVSIQAFCLVTPVFDHGADALGA